MNAEKEIVSRWLNNKGFFTMPGIPVGKREIDMIAKRGKDVWHVEIIGAVTSVDNIPLKDIREKFINKTVSNTILKLVGQNYKKVLIIGKTNNPERYKQLKEIKVFRMSDVLFEFISGLGTHNYKALATRTSQLIKHLLLSDPDNLAKLLDKDNTILNLQTREKFLKALMEQEETKRVLAKKSFEPEMIKIIKNSSLKNPEKLANALEENILTKKTRKKFLETLLKSKEVKKEISTISKDQSSLRTFFR